MAGAVQPSEGPSLSLSFRNTQLFHLVMKALESTGNTTSLPDLLDGSSEVVSLSSSYGEESLVAAIIVIGAIFSILTTVGNLMVMISFKIDKQLQTISNYFLFSLAVADVAIGMISIPLMTYYFAMRSWGIGYTMCQFWLCVDYLMSNASVLNLLLISFDRYFSVTRPLSYRPRRTTKKALTMIACTYIISTILWPPWIISWPYIEGKFTVEPGTCVVQFLETNPYVTVGTAIAAFYLPVTIMIILYFRVYRETQKRQKEFGKLQASQFPRRSIRRDTSSNSIIKNERSGSEKKHAWSFSLSQNKPTVANRKRASWLRYCTGRSQTSSEDSSEAAVVNVDDTSMTSSLYTSKRKNTSPTCSPMPPNEDTQSAETHVENSPRNGSYRFRSRDRPDRPVLDTYTVLIELKDEGTRPSVRLSTCESPVIERPENVLRSKSEMITEHANEFGKRLSHKETTSPTKNGRLLKGFSSVNDRKSEKERKKNERKQESKAAKTLSAILCAFIVTWTPYNLIVCWEAFFPKTIPDTLFQISYCLCYINSTINPLCYALCNARFRHTYQRILRCKYGTERPNISRNAYIRRQC
ncbi:unnamed protein product [Auanema sp. JU1783]|nr:unnamed protein product [Auanema sp. JU1783]